MIVLKYGQHHVKITILCYKYVERMCSALS